MIVVPIGFVSDHVEVVWDLDHEAADTAQAAGLFFARVRTPGTDPRFVADLADLIRDRLSATTDAFRRCWPASMRRPDFCADRMLRERPGDPADHRGCGFADRTGRPWTSSPERLAASGIRGVDATRR